MMSVPRIQCSDRLLLRPPDAFFLFFTLFLETRAFADDLLFDLLHFLALLRGVRVVELLLQKDLPLRQFSLVNTVDFGEPILLLC